MVGIGNKIKKPLIKKQKKDSLITEDDQKKLEEKGQKLTDEFIKDIETILAAKEKEILSV